MAVQIISDDQQFKADLLQAVQDKLNQFSNTLHTSEQDELLTREETSKLLRVTLSTLWSWNKSGKLSSVSIGNRIYYRRSSINKALTQND